MGWKELNGLLDNVGAEHFNKDSFVQAYNEDTRVNKLVDSFDENGLVLAGAEPTKSDEPDDKTVDQMADRATKTALK